MLERNEASRAEWLERRRQGLGASDVAAVLGLNPWRTAVSVYLEKVGLSADEDATENMEWGKEMEQVIAQRFARRAELPIEWLDATIAGPEPWMFATPDFHVVAKPQGGECKYTGHRDEQLWGEELSDKVPDYYITQAQWQMAVTDWQLVWMPVLFSGRRREMVVYRIYRDDELIEKMVDGCRRFWVDNVLAQVQPDLDWSDASKDYLRERFPRPVDEVREATQEEGELAVQYAKVQATTGQMIRLKDTLANQIKERIGPHKAIVGPGFKLTWSEYPASTYTVNKKAGRSLRASGEIFKEAKLDAG